MRYLGGKARIAKRLAAVINQLRQPGQEVWDAFCGGMWMTAALSAKGPVVSTDANPALIALYSAIRAGWKPPTEVSKATWDAAKTLPDSDPMKAFCGFGCSYGGMWFAGYAAGYNGPLTYAQLASRNSQTHAQAAAYVACVDFMRIPPGPSDGIIYCDPPYRGTASYAAVSPFDSDAFERRVYEWSAHCDLFVSEYQLSIGEVVWSRTAKTTLGQHSNSEATEKLFFVAKGTCAG